MKIKAIFSKATDFVWRQEEPEIMGAWPYMCRKFRKSELQLDVISRNEGSSTATGFAKQHQAQQLHIITKAFDVPASKPAKKAAEKEASVATN